MTPATVVSSIVSIYLCCKRTFHMQYNSCIEDYAYDLCIILQLSRSDGLFEGQEICCLRGASKSLSPFLLGDLFRYFVARDAITCVHIYIYVYIYIYICIVEGACASWRK